MSAADAGRVTVLGGSGFIGSHVARHLRRLGVACDTPARDDESIFSRPLGHVIYAIGLTADFRARPLETVEAHVCLLRRLIAGGGFSSLTYLSSTRVYAGSADTRETAPLRVCPAEPGDLYNLSKLTGEALCLSAGRAAAKVVRLSSVVGLPAAADSFIGQLLDEGRRSGRVLFRTTAASRKDYLWVGDAAEAIGRIALSPESGIFNLASGAGTANREIAQALAAELGFEVAFAADAAVWDFAAIDVSRAKTRFGFAPRRFAEFFPEFLRACRTNQGR